MAQVFCLGDCYLCDKIFAKVYYTSLGTELEDGTQAFHHTSIEYM